MKKVLVLYVPVIHKGYLELLRRHQHHADDVYILSDTFFEKFSPLREIRALDSFCAAALLEKTGIIYNFRVLEERHIPSLKGKEIITLDDEICRQFAEEYLHDEQVEFDTAFLRWDSRSVYSQSDVSYDAISRNSFDRTIMKMAQEESNRTSDWWRQVGAIAVDPENTKTLLRAHNRHVPSNHTPYILGDPRDFIEAGKDSHLASAMHAEQRIIAAAAREGISLAGKHLYVSVFPCPVCAKLIAYSGITKVFFSSGHASLDGEAVLKSQGVKIILIQ